jgi:hypothetical protein
MFLHESNLRLFRKIVGFSVENFEFLKLNLTVSKVTLVMAGFYKILQ